MSKGGIETWIANLAPWGPRGQRGTSAQIRSVVAAATLLAPD